MKKRRFSVLLIFLSILTLLFTGCNVDSFAYINPDGSKVEYNTNSGTITINEPEEVSIPDEEEIVEDEEEVEIVEDVTEDDEPEEISEDSEVTDDAAPEVPEEVTEDSGLTVDEDGEYTSKEEVALYIHLYNHLPGNYITKSEAQDLGWDSSQGKHLNKVAPGKSIGGDKFGNREGLLPKKDGRVYYECDIDYVKGSRNAKRIVFSNDGLIYYTEDHYESYELLYE